MPRSNPPREGDGSAVDSGWSSLPPAPRAADESSGVQPLASRHRADGTLLGVAPPGAPAATASRHHPVIVHAGDSAAREATLPVPMAPAATVEPLVAEPAAAQLPPPPAEPVAPPVREATPALKPPVAPRAAVPHDEAPELGFFAALGQRVRSLGVEVPLWVLLVPLLAAFIAASALLAFVAGARHAPQPVRASQPTPVVEVPAAAAAPEPAPDTAAIQAKPPEARTAAETLALAGLATEKKRDAAAHFNQDLLQTPALLQKKATLNELRKLVSDPVTAPRTLAAVASLPAPTAADLLYELWSGTPNKTDATELARALLSSKDVHPKVSDALALALELRAVDTCGDLSLMLERARQVGDKRSLAPLNKWKHKRVCSKIGQRDCCSLDQGKNIDAAIDAVKARRAPFDGS